LAQTLPAHTLPCSQPNASAGIDKNLAHRARTYSVPNQVSRIAAMCRSVDQPVLMSSAFASVGDIKRRLVSVGRYVLRGVAHPQELFTLNPEA